MRNSTIKRWDRTKPASFVIELALDWNPLSAKWVLRGSERATFQKPISFADLTTDGLITPEDFSDVLGALDTRAHMMLSRLLDVQQALF